MLCPESDVNLSRSLDLTAPVTGRVEPAEQPCKYKRLKDNVALRWLTDHVGVPPQYSHTLYFTKDVLGQNLS